jgi:hypothetical protein
VSDYWAPFAVRLNRLVPHRHAHCHVQLAVACRIELLDDSGLHGCLNLADREVILCMLRPDDLEPQRQLCSKAADLQMRVREKDSRVGW